ncbi:hydrogenase maturation nickel metallochaperone HypA [Desulfurivibrio sp. C05AmB]|jgi:hydrogenase nickel incorporation protein HypA/HybF|uniref:hydrogenase maturation nickel metallochaperone HypA/HybF n=1 Tax=Desulfurivibrio sp. C05AmB TaxID=3374371 RepID=UPI00376F37B1
MHEMSIALNIVELAEKESRAAGGAKIRRIEVEVGALAGVMEDALHFCFAAACRDTLAEGAELLIRTTPGEGECVGCRQVMPMTTNLELCPACGGLLRMRQGAELRLIAIVVD